MYLKKLEIVGFKSFAVKTEVVFEKGVTCVVGPNGCGKSNISDAIRWVLGERSAKILRGSKMEDVIFHGTDSQEPVNFAEVTLTIDNADHVLPIQFDEVSITRRLFRSGESEYLLNKTICRLKDIQDIILDTGIGSNSYSMIEQGRIDYILTAEAEERRFLIEEAAGISKYKVKKEEAIRKLEHTEQNLLRLKDIVAEVERNIKYAERQARRAEQYKVFLDQLKSLERAKLSKELIRWNETLRELTSEREKEDGMLQKHLGTLSELEAKQREANAQFDSLEREYFEAEHERIQWEQKLTSAQHERETTRERYHETKTALDRAIEEITSTDENLTRLLHDLETKELELQNLVKIGETLQSDIAEKENFLATCHQSVNEKSMLVFQYREESFELASKLAQLRNDLNKLHSSSQYWQERKKQIAASLDRLSTESFQTDHQEQTLTSETDLLKLSVSEHQETLERLVLDKERVFNELRTVQEGLADAKEKKLERAHRLDLLKKLDGAAYASVKESLDRRCDTAQCAESVKSLLDLLEIEEGYEIATAAVLSEFAKAVVTENAKSALHLLQCVQEDGHHQVSILIKDHAEHGHVAELASSDAPAHELLQARLLDVLKIKEGYEKLFGRLLGDVYVVNEITEDNAAACNSLAHHVRLVSKHGACLGRGFQLSFRNGSPHPLQDLRKRDQERLELNATIHGLDEQAKEKEETKQRLEAELAQLEATLKEAGTELVQFQLQLERMESQLRNIQNQKTRHRQEIDLSTNELNEIDTNEAKCRELEEKLAIQIEEAGRRETEIKTALEAAGAAIDEKKKLKEEQLIDLTRAKTQFESHDRTLTQVREALALMKTNQNDWEKRLESLKQDQTNLKARLLQLEERSEQLARQEQDSQRNLISTSSIAEQRKQKRNETLASKSQIEGERQAHQELVLELRNKLHALEKQTMEIEYQKHSALDRVQNTYHMTLEEQEILQTPSEEIDWDRLTDTIEGLKKKVETYGAVNLLAIEEYEELKQRFDFLNAQQKDLEESKESLMEAIRKINRTTKQLFEETFTRVREMFQAYFKILFRGGEADLILIDETNPLDSGIDIVARPPGKKLQHITLLSGGEKAMTAIALLFALFKVKPSPFCVLDEIDAPLDEANNDRFLEVVQEFLANTQFIIITHSRKTIAMGHSLYGVTMERAGVSKLVSVKVSRHTSTIQHADEKIQKELNAVLQ